MAEKQKQDLDELLETHGVHLNDGHVVCWEPDSDDHPRNWKTWKKCYTTAIVIWLEFYMTVLSSSGVAPAKKVQQEYSISMTIAILGFTSIYLLGQTVGGIFCSPISEFFGRRTIYIIATALFTVSSVIVTAPNHIAGIFVGRFFMGIAAAIPATVAFGNFSDMFVDEYRIWAVYAYTLLGMSGLSLGPIYSSYVTSLMTWQWVFYISAIASAISTAACFLIKESNASQLLEAKTKSIGKATGNTKLKPDVEHLQTDSVMKDFLKNNIYRPITFVATEPLITLCAALCATAFGLIYGLTESLIIVYTTPPFDEVFDETSASLSFLAILIGEVLNVIPRIYDAQVLKHQNRRGHTITPEIKIRSFAIACPVLAVGLWIFAWTVPVHSTNISWVVSMIGLIFIGFSANDFSYVLFGYITDSYGSHAASAVSVLSAARTLAGAAFPLFVTQFYHGLGNNVATSVLAAVATVFCFTPYLFLRYGSELRARSKWASKDDDDSGD